MREVQAKQSKVNSFSFDVTLPNDDVFRFQSTDGWDLTITRPDARPFDIETLSMDGGWGCLGAHAYIRLVVRQYHRPKPGIPPVK